MTNQTRKQPGHYCIAADILGGGLSILKGLWVTISVFFRPKETVRYPFKERESNYVPRPGYRGDFALITNNETGELRCTACMSCVKACPDACIHVVGEGKGKERKPVAFHVDVGLCMFCWMCVEACPFDALTMTPDYEQAEDDPRKLIRDLDTLRERGLEYDDVLKVQTAEAPPEVAETIESGEPTE